MKKKILVIYILIITVLFLTLIAYAEENDEFTKVLIDGKEQEVRKINILVNGKPIESDVPSILYQERTLVPIRFVANYLNAEVEWNQETKEATIKTVDKEIVLKIDSSIAIINGEKKQIPYNVPAKLINDSRTMVPLRFVSEALDFDVDWIPETWTGTINFKHQKIEDMYVESEDSRYASIIVKTTGLVSHKDIYLEEPYRLVIDIPNTKLDIKNNSLEESKGVYSLNVNIYPVKKVRASQFSEEPDVTRLVFDLEDYYDYDVEPFTDGSGLKISFINKVNGIKLENINGKDAIVVDNTYVNEYNVFRLDNPDRIVVDILNSKLMSDKYSYTVNSDIVKGIRMSQFKPDALYNENDKIVRIVLDIYDDAEKPDIFIGNQDGDMIIYIEKEISKYIGYEKDKDGSPYIKINLEKKVSYDLEYDELNKSMKIAVDRKYLDIPEGMLVVKDDLIDNIFIKESDEKKIITISFKNNVIYDVKSNNKDDEIYITFLDTVKKYSDKLIVIDPGHGGKDPGATSPTTKAYEKDLNLRVALLLNEKLQELGFKTLMTRDDDTYIGLYERAGIANKNDADLFVSIHHNYNDNKNTSGVQVYYCPAYNSEIKEEDNYPLSKRLHEELLKELGAVDKGIIKKPEFVVIRETKMVAALVELGFLSNPQEEQKLNSEEYQKKEVDAIAKGIVRYFEEVVFSK